MEEPRDYIVILGAGESGIGAAVLAKSREYQVFVSDIGIIATSYKDVLESNKIEYEEERHSSEKILNADLIIKSPGIPDDAPIVIEARKREIPVIAEIEFAFRHSDAQFIAITGTNGKTTTTRLIYHLLKETGFNVGVGGNVGQSLSGLVATGRKDWFVVELSSFQLDNMYSFHPHVAVILNITPDHLNRYGNDFELYVRSKLRITKNLDISDTLIYWGDDNVLTNALEKTDLDCLKLIVSIEDTNASAYLMKGYLSIGELHLSISDLPLKGKHNYINIMCAVSAALAVGADRDKIISGLSSYINAPHRMEVVESVNGIQFINDSKATNVESVFYALDAFHKPITWIAGGIDKGNDYSRLKPMVEEKVEHMVCLGVDNKKLIEAFGDILETIVETSDVREAARKAYEYSEKNDVVLFSPACASFDLFRNYEDRGDQFKRAVLELKNEVETTN